MPTPRPNASTTAAIFWLARKPPQKWTSARITSTLRSRMPGASCSGPIRHMFVANGMPTGLRAWLMPSSQLLGSSSHWSSNAIRHQPTSDPDRRLDRPGCVRIPDERVVREPVAQQLQGAVLLVGRIDAALELVHPVAVALDELDWLARGSRSATVDRARGVRRPRRSDRTGRPATSTRSRTAPPRSEATDRPSALPAASRQAISIPARTSGGTLIS